MSIQKIAIVFFLILFIKNSDAQDSLNLDMIKSPSSPAFTILGINPTDIEEPSTPTDLFLSVKNATESFSTFPTSYSLDLAPGWIFGGSNLTYEDFKSDKLVDAIKQNSTISFATNKKVERDSNLLNQIGLGIKISLDRGNFDENYEKYKLQSDSIYSALDTIAILSRRLALAACAADADCQEIENKIDSLNTAGRTLKNSMTNEQWRDYMKSDDWKAYLANRRNLAKQKLGIEEQLNDQITDSLTTEANSQIAYLRYAAENLKFQRTGFKLDFAAGASFDFTDQKFENGTIGRYGAWLTGGNEWKMDKGGSTLTLLGTSRLLLFPDEQYEFNADTLVGNNLRFDAGIRVIFKTPNKKLIISAEVLNRSVVNNNDIPNTYKASFNLDYAILRNKSITLSLGRNFDGTFEEDGNLIAAINFIAGFGSNRPF